ncbi:alpha/beta fold hydrolase [Sphingomonas sp. CL5.1]|uniref:alpha/beta hydrolase n=1 Tax=Sphingomonas sp. CL5.1 TaxID=2653203 RepID=UPI001583B72C|nr:alpha/beta fold hydrolase [Sphingomonas sp. CL5.1]QKR99924.1 alpha/beta fold hydrolase [Sphingomonas sp. CL5.1]
MGGDATTDVIAINYSGKSEHAHGPLESVENPESQAALRQFSLERIIAYGVHYSDAMELRGRVWAGEAWRDVATELAETCLKPAESAVAPETDQTRANRIFRSSALWRMSQAMMLRDSDERTEIYRRSAELYQAASVVAGDRTRIMIDTSNGPLVGWLHKSATPTVVGRVLVVGGFEGWGMDCGEVGVALASRGIETLAIDGPGQGESRMILHHYMTADWEKSYAAVFDFLAGRGPEPIGIFGLSVGGSVTTHLARREERIAACVNNGGPGIPWMVRHRRGAAAANKGASFFQKVAAQCGDVTDDEAEAVWRTVDPRDSAHPLLRPYLFVHSAVDPLVSNRDAQDTFATIEAQDKTMAVFSDGLHCVYNHPDDKFNLVGDWFVSRLRKAGI